VLAPVLAFAATPTDAEISDAIREKIRERHPTADCAWWKAQGARTPRVIESLLVTPESRLGRLRLIEGLGCFADPASIAKVQEVAETSQERVIRLTAVRAVARSGDAAAPLWLKGFLTHEDPHTRVAAAEALVLTGDPLAASWIREQAAVEKVGWVTRKFGKVSGGAQGSGRVQGIVLPKSGQPPHGGPTGTEADAAAQARLEKLWSGTWRGYRIVQPPASKPPQAAAVLLDVEFKDHQPRVRFWLPVDLSDSQKARAGGALEVSELRMEQGRWTGRVVETGGLRLAQLPAKTPERTRTFEIEAELHGAEARPGELVVHVTEVTVGAIAQPWVLLR
jgi:hypothetical protein